METRQSISFYQVAQQKIDMYLHHINLSSRDVIRYISIFGIAFLCGIICKRYGAMIFSWIIGIILLGLVLNYFDLIIINRENIKQLLNIQHIHSLDDLVVFIKIKINIHGIECIISLLAIILGFKLG